MKPDEYTVLLRSCLVDFAKILVSEIETSGS